MIDVSNNSIKICLCQNNNHIGNRYHVSQYSCDKQKNLVIGTTILVIGGTVQTLLPLIIHLSIVIGANATI